VYNTTGLTNTVPLNQVIEGMNLNGKLLVLDTSIPWIPITADAMFELWDSISGGSKLDGMTARDVSEIASSSDFYLVDTNSNMPTIFHDAITGWNMNNYTFPATNLFVRNVSPGWGTTNNMSNQIVGDYGSMTVDCEWLCEHQGQGGGEYKQWDDSIAGTLSTPGQINTTSTATDSINTAGGITAAGGLYSSILSCRDVMASGAIAACGDVLSYGAGCGLSTTNGPISAGGQFGTITAAGKISTTSTTPDSTNTTGGITSGSITASGIISTTSIVTNSINTTGGITSGGITASGIISTTSIATNSINTTGGITSGGITTQGIAATNLTVYKDSSAPKNLDANSTGNYVAIGGPQISPNYMLTANGSAYILNDLSVMGTFTANSGFETNGRIWADTIKGNTVEISDTINATNVLSTDGNLDVYSGDFNIGGSIFLTGRGGIALATQTINQWSDIQQYFNQTITHRTNIINHDDSKIGCFCETTSELADVYDKDVILCVPSLSRPTDARCKVRPSNTLNSKVIGIVANHNTFISHGDCLVIVKQGPQYEVGDILTVHSSGVCRKADEQDKLFMLMNGIPLPKITIIFSTSCEFVGCFVS
jgi:hypothetical protein